MIDEPTLARLQTIGLKPAVLQALPSLQALPRLHRLIEVQREHLLLHDGRGARRARPLPALCHALEGEGDALAVGDWVLAEPDAFGTAWVHERLPPLTRITRRLHDGRDKVARVAIAHNVDTALLVMGLDHDFNLRRLDRYLALTRLAGVGAVLVLTKADLCTDVPQRLAAASALLPAGVAAIAVNALDAATAQALAPWMSAGETLVLLGSSGAGKSTLTNTLVGSAVQRTAEVRDGDGRGRHTTTVRSLHATPAGACIVDTPGLRSLRLDADEEGVDAAFDEVARLAPRCRFRDCRHEHEPGCAVRDGLPAERLRSYHKLQREARRDTMSVLERQRQLSEWKARGRAGRARAQHKRD